MTKKQYSEDDLQRVAQIISKDVSSQLQAFAEGIDTTIKTSVREIIHNEITTELKPLKADISVIKTALKATNLQVQVQERSIAALKNYYCMKLYSWNVNGIRAVINKGLFQEFIKQHQPDILCLQETKAMQGQAEIDLPEYEEYWNSADKKGYSGTAIFTKTKPLSVINGFPPDIIEKYRVEGDVYGDPNKEGRVIAAEFEDFWLVTVYTPNAKDDLSRIPMRQKWDPAFLAYCKQLEQTKYVIFCGDLNVAHTEDDLARPKENRGKKGFTDEERAGFQAFIDKGFIDTFRLFTEGNGHYTWWTHWANSRARNVGWRIDYFLASEALKSKITKAKIHADVMGSDHCPVSIELQT
jgi:exodeoxyribonuclease III